MAWEENNREELRGAPQRTEIGDVLLSARAVSRQMIARAESRADETVKEAERRADAIIQEAEAKAARIVREAEEKAVRLMNGEEAPTAAPDAESAELPGPDVERIKADAAAEAQEYAARCVEECLAELRRREQDTVDFINEQWQSFLCGLMLGPEAGKAAPEMSAPAAEEAAPISQQEIEAKVNAIARELMEIIGK